MKVKTLVAMMMQEINEVNWYDDNMNLISRMSIGTLKEGFGDCKVKKFGIYKREDDYDYETILEIVMK